MQRYLEITYRNGKPLAAYLYLDRRSDDVSARTERHAEGLLVDFAEDNRPIGIEISAPSRVRLEALNRILRSLELQPLSEPDLAPLAAA